MTQLYTRNERGQFVKIDEQALPAIVPAVPAPVQMTPPPVAVQTPKRRFAWGKVGLTFLIVALLGGLGVSVYFYWTARQQLAMMQVKGVSDTASPAQRAAAIIEKVGKHITLPKEQPQVVAIADVERLRKDQPFFVQAHNGDYVLVYPGRVILYSPTLDRVVDIAQIRTTPTPATESALLVSPTQAALPLEVTP